MDTLSVTDRIYEAAVVPELWPKVLIVHLLPVRGVAHDVFTQSAAIVMVTPVEPHRSRRGARQRVWPAFADHHVSGR